MRQRNKSCEESMKKRQRNSKLGGDVKNGWREGGELDNGLNSYSTPAFRFESSLTPPPSALQKSIVNQRRILRDKQPGTTPCPGCWEMGPHKMT